MTKEVSYGQPHSIFKSLHLGLKKAATRFISQAHRDRTGKEDHMGGKEYGAEMTYVKM